MEPYIVYDDVQLGDAVNEKRSEIIALQTVFAPSLTLLGSIEKNLTDWKN